MEEWNEYGELKEKIGSGGPALSSPSIPSTPSKAPLSNQTQSSAASQPSKSSLESPLTASMRQISFEAAKKASDTKLSAHSKAAGQSISSNDEAKKSNISTPAEVPSNRGTTEPNQTIAPEDTSAAFKPSVNVPATSKTSEEPTIASNMTKPDLKDNEIKSEILSTPMSKESTEPEPKPHIAKEIPKESIEDKDAAEVHDEAEADGEEETKPVTKLTYQDSTTQSQNPPSATKDIEEDPVLVALTRGKTGGPILDSNKEDEKVKDKDVESATRTQDQPAASAHEAGESVGD